MLAAIALILLQAVVPSVEPVATKAELDAAIAAITSSASQAITALTAAQAAQAAAQAAEIKANAAVQPAALDAIQSQVTAAQAAAAGSVQPAALAAVQAQLTAAKAKADTAIQPAALDAVQAQAVAAQAAAAAAVQPSALGAYATTAALPAMVAANAPVTSVNGGTGAVVSTKMQATSISTTAVTNTTTETSIVGTLATGSNMSVPATACFAGKAYRLRVAGQFTTPLAPGNITARVKLGATVVGATTVTNLLALANNSGWSGDVLIVFRSCGAAGSVVVGGNITYDTGIQIPGSAGLFNGVQTVNTTAALAVDATAQWATASTTRSIGTYLVSLESLN